MRTTLDLDDALLAEAQARFPPGTPKTVIVEEGLRRLAQDPSPRARRAADPRLQRLVDDGSLTLASVSAPPPGPGGFCLPELLADLARDRDDR